MQKQITILDRSYTLRADEDDDLERAAADVDQRMRVMVGRSQSFDGYTAALLTALNLASELRALRQRFRARLEELDHQAATVEAVLEAAVADDGDPADDSAAEGTN